MVPGATPNSLGGAWLDGVVSCAQVPSLGGRREVVDERRSSRSRREPQEVEWSLDREEVDVVEVEEGRESEEVTTTSSSRGGRREEVEVVERRSIVERRSTRGASGREEARSLRRLRGREEGASGREEVDEVERRSTRAGRRKPPRRGGMRRRALRIWIYSSVFPECL